jgi:hypothetical protein
MTYALMIWTIIACDAYSCKSDWREALAFENTSYAKEM